MIMQGTIAKWGNSLGLRLPKPVADRIKLSEGDTVEMVIEDDALVIRASRKRYKLAELLADYDPQTEKASETQWGKPEGTEAW